MTKQNSESCQQLSWKKFYCEVCKVTPPKTLLVEGKEIELIGVKRPKEPYIILESMEGEHMKDLNSLYLLRFHENLEAKKIIRLGRASLCETRICDISVSRIHAQFELAETGFRLYDVGSKFGTLLLLKEPLKITSDKIAVQVGRTIFTFTLKEWGMVETSPSFAIKAP